MKSDVLDRLLITLAVRMHAFSICQIQHGWRLLFGSFEAVTMHYILEGHGSVRVGNGAWIPFAPGSMVVIPAGQPHMIGEAGPVLGEARAWRNQEPTGLRVGRPVCAPCNALLN